MRALILLLALAPATPAMAQDALARLYGDEAGRVAAEQAARQRDIALTNELSRLQAQAQTTQNLSDLAAMRIVPAAPVIRYDPNGPPPKLDTSQFAQIPDAALADSVAKVRAAANNRR